MFGGLACLLGGNLAAVAASGQGGMMARVDPAQGDALVARTPARTVAMRGRPLRGWLTSTPNMWTRRLNSPNGSHLACLCPFTPGKAIGRIAATTESRAGERAPERAQARRGSRLARLLPGSPVICQKTRMKLQCIRC
jgi:hypothetical protein